MPLKQYVRGGQTGHANIREKEKIKMRLRVNTVSFLLLSLFNLFALVPKTICSKVVLLRMNKDSNLVLPQYK